MRALDIITDAYERLNRLSPGETLGNDEAAFGLRRLNLLVDEWAARPAFLFRNVVTSAAQTGAITLGAGSWAAIAPGTKIVGVTQAGEEVVRIDMAQYNLLPTQAGTPTLWAHDGLSTVYLWPSATGQTIGLQWQVGASAFADQTTSYTTVPGYESALGAALAVRLAPPVLGRLPPELVRAETRALAGINNYTPKILNVDGFGESVDYNIANG